MVPGGGMGAGAGVGGHVSRVSGGWGVGELVGLVRSYQRSEPGLYNG